MKKFLISFYVSMLDAIFTEIEDPETKKQLLITKNRLLKEIK